MRTVPALPSLAGDPEISAARLRRMKRTATVCLLAAAAVFVVTTAVPGLGTIGGFAQAGAEAAMVGGLADWFAVTALFRRPLGLPIPHTALVPRKKDELATKLGQFVTGYFLTPEVLQQQVAESGIVKRVGLWMAEPARSAALARDVAAAGAVAIEALDPQIVVDYVLELVRSDVARRSYAPVLGRLLARSVEAGAPRPLVDILLERAVGYLRANQTDLHPTVKRFVEDRHWVAWLVTTDRVVDKLFRDTIAEMEAVRRFPDHPVRRALDGLLRSVADDLCHDPSTQAQVDALVVGLVEDPHAQAVLRDMVAGALESVRESLADPGGALTGRIAGLIADLGLRAAEDAPLHDQIERWLEAMVGHAVSRYGHEVTDLIRRQVGAWPAEAASHRIELAVGRDLQFIRINGTAVGALAGLAIHAVALAIS
ncbi:MAG TPA: DUF445 domain-containing protein [Acidimicrobiales bacterium]|nr:DUF445 domain-containing protein [Acidimicrobiales bacterium]